MKHLVLLLVLLPDLSFADTLVAARTIRSQTILTAADVAIQPADRVGGFTSPDEVIGLEARVALYAGRPIQPGDVGPAAVIERNQIVPLIYRGAGLTIIAEARALGRAGPGDQLRVMNLGSRSTVNGTVTPDGSVLVGN